MIQMSAPVSQNEGTFLSLIMRSMSYRFVAFDLRITLQLLSFVKRIVVILGLRNSFVTLFDSASSSELSPLSYCSESESV